MLKQEEKYILGRATKKRRNRAIKKQRKTIGPGLSFTGKEAYKVLRTNLMGMPDEGKCKLIGITSPLRGEGKSTTAINLAYTMAEMKKKTLLIEGDMRAPIIKDLLQLENPLGLAHVLTNRSDVKDSISQSAILNSLYVLPAGEIMPNPSKLLSSKRMGKALATLSQSYDYIIIDLPSIAMVNDGLVLSNWLSGMVVVMRHNYCDQYALADAMERMKQAEVRVLGFVLNREG